MKRAYMMMVAAAALLAPPAFAQGRGGAQTRADSGTRTLEREVFTYQAGGRRDPMLSLVMSGDLRPLVSEVELVAIVYDEGGSNHMALLRNIGGSKDKGKLYRIKVGQMLGRMRVTQITRKEVVFTLDEFGFSRQQRLAVRPDTTARTP
jgi:hypothetical protein